MLAIGTPSQGINPVRGIAQCMEPFPRRDFPDLDGPVSGARCQHFAVGAKCQAVDGIAVVFQGHDLFSGGHIPQFDEAIVAAGG